MSTSTCVTFNQGCRECTRLAVFLDEVRQSHPDYYAHPVPAFGEVAAELLIVGLAPGMHGANRTGRPFHGDHAGILLYQTLFKFGFSNQKHHLTDAQVPDQNLRLFNCRFTNAVKCLPPDNKPEPSEIRQCNHYLSCEIASSPQVRVVLGLGLIAHQAVLRAINKKPTAYKFAHGARHALPNGKILLNSYHCSRYNTSTRRLTPEMFEAVFAQAKAILTTG